MTDIRRFTTIIIRKNGLYLVGRELHDGPPVWSRYRWDAYGTRDREKARDLARDYGGVMVLFNPIVGQERIL